MSDVVTKEFGDSETEILPAGVQIWGRWPTTTVTPITESLSESLSAIGNTWVIPYDTLFGADVAKAIGKQIGVTLTEPLSEYDVRLAYMNAAGGNAAQLWVVEGSDMEFLVRNLDRYEEIKSVGAGIVDSTIGTTESLTNLTKMLPYLLYGVAGLAIVGGVMYVAKKAGLLVEKKKK